MSFVTGENAVPLTGVFLSTDTRQQLGDRVHDAAGRHYMFVQNVASFTSVISYGNAIGFYDSDGYLSGQVATSTVGPVSQQQFAGIACNKKSTAGAGHKYWIMYNGPLGFIANSKLKSGANPISLYAKTNGNIAQGNAFSMVRATKALQPAVVSTSRPVGQATEADSGTLLTKGFIKSRILS